ncbi:MAG: flavodoxin domain-containing protein [Thermodesulfobacteriota bacterium]|nr:flavodoxin domain-containing protein [Thermodesulfobacteriota bacterium]
MGKVLIGYESRKGHTEKMAKYIAEGARMAGNEVEVKALRDLKSEDNIKGYDAYLFGCPTYHRDMTNSMKTFLFLADKAGLEGKTGGAFGSYTHSGDAPKLILDTMENVFHMNATNLGSFNLLEDKIETDAGMRACQQYGRAVTE